MTDEHAGLEEFVHHDPFVAGAAGPDLAGLVAARICHDLISPLGAIGNGVELLGLSGASAGPEMALIADSAAHAGARLRFLRLALGAAAPGQPIAAAEVAAILAASGGRIRWLWEIPGPLDRARVRLAFLCLMCLESALPRGGTVRIAAEGAAWRLAAEAPRFREIGGLWAAFDGAAETVAPAEVQFALAPRVAAGLGIALRCDVTEERIVLTLAPR